MKSPGIYQILTLILLSISFYDGQVNAQMPLSVSNQVSIVGWADDTHYLIRTFDAEKKPVVKSVDIKTGKGVIIPPVKTERDLLSQLLPQGTTLTMQ